MQDIIHSNLLNILDFVLPRYVNMCLVKPSNCREKILVTYLFTYLFWSLIYLISAHTITLLSIVSLQTFFCCPPVLLLFSHSILL